MSIQMEEQLQRLIATDPTKLVFLCGAGISLDKPTSLPTVNTLICDLLRQCEVGSSSITKIKQQFGKTNYRFESLIGELQKKCDSNLLITKLFESNSYNTIHSFLGEMLKKGSSIITTNFDNCIENSCGKDFFVNNHKRIVYTGDDLNSSEESLSGMLIKIHGSHPLISEHSTELVITIRTLAKTERAFLFFPNWKKYLLKLINGKIIVVMGYSCSDDFDVVPLLEEAAPTGIIWINFDREKEFPEVTNKIDNIKIEKLSEKLPITYFNGLLVPYLKYWADKNKMLLHEGELENNFTVKDYINKKYPTSIEKQVLCNEIFLSYGLYDEIAFSMSNAITKMQKIKAEFRLGHYKEVVVFCRQIESEKESTVEGENLYYFASALYYNGDYSEALEIAKKCITYARKIDDKNLYLNAMNNYASILYVYASTLPKKDEQPRLEAAERMYSTVLLEAEGVNLEARANALWGLGDLERYRGNIFKSKQMLTSALEILENIGNKYAIDQLRSIIKEIEETGH